MNPLNLRVSSEACWTVTAKPRKGFEQASAVSLAPGVDERAGSGEAGGALLLQRPSALSATFLTAGASAGNFASAGASHGSRLSAVVASSAVPSPWAEYPAAPGSATAAANQSAQTRSPSSNSDHVIQKAALGGISLSRVRRISFRWWAGVVNRRGHSALTKSLGVATYERVLRSAGRISLSNSSGV